MNKYTISEYFTRLACKVVGIKQLESGTSQEWREYEQLVKSKGKVAYFVVSVLPHWIGTFCHFFNVLDHIHSVAYFLRMKIFGRYDIIETGLTRQYWDDSERLLHGMFNLLKDHVEIEKAYMHFMSSKEEREKYHYPWWANVFRVIPVRNVEAGLEHLRWETTLDEDPEGIDSSLCISQAQTAREILVLYDWWINVRPNRPDVYEVSGWLEECKKHDILADWRNTPETRAMLDKVRELELKYDNEDEAMLIRLVKIRQALWT